jgi:hypothetical protein
MAAEHRARRSFGMWRVAKLLAEFLGRLLLAFGDLPAIDQNVLFVAADSSEPKENLSKPIRELLEAGFTRSCST